MKNSKYSTTLLPVTLTQEEFDTKAHSLSILCKTINVEKDRAKEQAKANKDRIDLMETERMNLATVVRDRAEERQVECEDRYNFRERMVESVRLDTGEITGTRAMNISEYQEEMDLHATPTENAVAFKKTAEA
jgi:hypothetical protein